MVRIQERASLYGRAIYRGNSCRPGARISRLVEDPLDREKVKMILGVLALLSKLNFACPSGPIGFAHHAF